MARRRYSFMVANDNILRADRNAAPTAAVLSLSAIALLELAMLGQAAFRQRPVAAPAPEPQMATISAPSFTPILPALPAKVSLPNVPAGLPPLPSVPTSTLALPPLPPLPSAGSTLPPLPGTTGGAPPLPAAPAPVRASAPVLPSPVPTSTPPEPSVPRTGNAEVDGLIEVAAQSRELGNADGAMKALERADLILPDNAVVMRQRALTLGKLGQTDKANAIWARLSQMGPGAGAVSTTPTLPPTSAAPGTPVDPLTVAFGAKTGGGVLSIGTCQIARDLTDTKGEKMVLKVPVRSQPGVVIDVSKMQVDVFFFDKVDAARVEPTQSDRPVYSFDTPVDFQSGEEIVTVVYHMPELTPAEIANIGNRQFYGYVVKLYYQQRLMGSAAAPRDLLGANTEPSAPAPDPATNGLLPPVR